MKPANAMPRIFLCLATLVMTACGSVLPRGEPATLWQLAPPQVAEQAKQGEPVDWQLRVAEPLAAGLLSGSRIVVMPEPGQLNVYQGARWEQSTAELWRDHLLAAFRSNGQLAAVSSDDDNLYADLVLGGTLDSFRIEYREGHPVAVLRYHAQLIDPRDSRVVAHRDFQATQASAGSEVPAVVAAFGLVANRVAADAVSWTLAEGSRYRNQHGDRP